MARLFVAPFFLLLLSHTPARAKFTSIHQVDFKNFIYPWDDPVDVPSTWSWMPLPFHERVRLVHGGRWLPVAGAAPEEHVPDLRFLLESVVYGHLGSDGQEVAAMYVSFSTGGTAGWGYVYVFRLKAGQPDIMGWLKTGSRADGGLIKIAIRDGLLVLDFENSSKREGDCCSDGYIRVSYRWQNGQFAEVPPRRYGPLQ